MVWLWLIGTTSAQVASLQQGDSVLADCLVDPDCGDWWTSRFAETLLEVGFAFDHVPIGTSALTITGGGLVAEIHLDTIPFGPRNELGEEWKAPPAVPRIGLGYYAHTSAPGESGEPDAAQPRFGVGVHVLPPLTVSRASVVSLGAVISGAIPVGPGLWLGGELDGTWSTVQASLLQSSKSLEDLDQLDMFLGANVRCEQTCLDRIRQLATGTHVALAFEPVQPLVVWVRTGATLDVSWLFLDLDDTRWRSVVMMPTLGTGLGVRLGARTQLGTGIVGAYKPPGASTARRTMIKAMATVSVRFGGQRPAEVPAQTH